MTRYLLFLFLFAFIKIGVSQSNYPVEIPVGQTETISASEQSLWVITNSQLDSVIVTAEYLKICNETNVEYQDKISKLEKIRIEQITIIDTLQKGYDHYIELWQKCDMDLEATEIKVVKQKKLHKWFASGGVAIGFLIALLIL